MLSSCLVSPVADQSVTENVAGVVSGDGGGAFTAVHGGCGSLAECLDQVVDHRSRQGLRYELGFLLAVVVAVVVAATACAGHDELAAQAQWAADAPVWVLTALGARPDPLTGAIVAPSESTLRRALAGVDAAELQRLTATWVQTTVRATRVRDADGARLTGVAIDGKSVRGRPPAAVPIRTCWGRPPTTGRSSSLNARSQTRAARSPNSSRWWLSSTSPARSSPSTPSTPNGPPPNTSSRPRTPTTS